ncbi:hypothetical protein SMA5143A_7942 [Streptomyces sp. MA5143a]|nr:hypothetical protein SMA5143A_7942 [Streptomyces sp. MA5143a]
MARWAAAGVIGQIRDHLGGGSAGTWAKAPAVGTVIDSQSVKAAETVAKVIVWADAAYAYDHCGPNAHSRRVMIPST